MTCSIKHQSQSPTRHSLEMGRNVSLEIAHTSAFISFHHPSSRGPTATRDVYTWTPSVPLAAYTSSNVKRQQLSAQQIALGQRKSQAPIAWRLSHSLPACGSFRPFHWPRRLQFDHRRSPNYQDTVQKMNMENLRTLHAQLSNDDNRTFGFAWGESVPLRETRTAWQSLHITTLHVGLGKQDMLAGPWNALIKTRWKQCIYCSHLTSFGTLLSVKVSASICFSASLGDTEVFVT